MADPTSLLDSFSSDTKQPESPLPKKKQKRFISVRTKLLAGYLSVAALAVLACLQAFYLFEEVRQGLTEITQGRVPELEQVLRIESTAKDIVSVTSQLRGIENAGERTTHITRLAMLWNDMRQLVDKLSTTPLAERFGYTLPRDRKRVDNLLYDLSLLDQLTVQRLVTRERRRKAFAEVQQLARHFERVIAPALDKAQEDKRTIQETILRLVRLGDGSEAMMTSFLTTVEQEEQFKAVNESGAELATLLLTASGTDDPNVLNDIQRELIPARRNLTMALDELTDFKYVQPLTAWLEQIEPYAIGTRALVRARRQELRLSKIVEGKLDAHAEAAELFVRHGGRLEEVARMFVRDVAESSQEKVEHSVQTMLVTAVIAVILVLGIVWFYVGRHIANPLVATARAMHDIAQAKTDTPLPKVGNDELGDMVGALTTLRNYVARVVKAESEVRSSQERLNGILESSRAGAVVVDADGRLLYFNARMAEMLGRGINDMLIVSWRDHYLDPESYQSMATDLHQDGGMARSEVQMVKGDTGEPFWVEVSYEATTFAGREAVFGWISDVDFRRKAQDALKVARDEAEAANRAKSSFLATMSHEIRTPMNGVVGMIELLRNTPLSRDQQEIISTAKSSAFALLNIIDDILDFSKIEAGKLELEAIPMSLRNVAEEVAETLLTHAQKRDVRLLLFIDPRLPDSLLGDPVRLRQILFNLGGNACKFMDVDPNKPNKVMIRVERQDCSAPNHVGVRMAISDTGIGMSPEAVRKLFKPFTQAEQSTTRRFGGTGLGLTICKNLTELMGGKIWVESAQGFGSTFYVDAALPIDPEAPPLATNEDTETLGGVRALVTLQDEQNQVFIGRYLNHWDVIWDAANDLADLVAIAESQAETGIGYDVVIIGSGWDQDEMDSAMSVIRDIDQPTPTRFLVLNEDRTEERGQISTDVIRVNTHPMRRSSFANALALAAGRKSPEIEAEADASVLDVTLDPPSVAEAEKLGRLVLVAEDHPVNQQVVKRQLGLLGYAAEVCDDGADGLEAYNSGRFSLILTDCHMPNLDGYQFTRKVRAAEQLDPEGNHIPIIALTANALVGEAERCKAAGMDDYLSKPVEMKLLAQKLHHWLGEPLGATNKEDGTSVQQQMSQSVVAPEPTMAAAYTTDLGPPPYDRAQLSAIVGDDDETINAMLAEFQETNQEDLSALEAALAAHDATEVNEIAHRIKGATRIIGAIFVADYAKQLEEAAEGCDWGTIETVLPGFIKEMNRLVTALSQAGSDAPEAITPDAPLPASTTATDCPIDRSVLAAIVGDDDEIIQAMLEEFADANQEDLDALDAALFARNAEDVNDVAHRIKGATKIIGAHDLADVAFLLEKAGDASDWAEIDRTLPLFRQEMDRLVSYLNNDHSSSATQVDEDDDDILAFQDEPNSVPTLISPDPIEVTPIADTPAPVTESPVELEVLKSVVGDDPEIIQAMLEEFADANQEDLAALNAGLAARDAEEVNEIAHRIKGAAKIIGAHQVAEVTFELEKAADAKNWAEIERYEPAFRQEMNRLLTWLEHLAE